MDLTIGSFNFCVGSLGLVRLSNPIELGPSAGKNAIAVTPEVLVGSPNEGIPLVSFKPKKGSTFQELREIMDNLDLEQTSDVRDNKRHIRGSRQ
jgi:hypothetical protein